MVRPLLLAAVAGHAAAQTIYVEEVLQEFEANAVNVQDYEFCDVYAEDSHNDMIDVCERVYKIALDGGSEDMCCTPDDRYPMIAGCDNVYSANGWSTSEMPLPCAAFDDDYFVCDEIDTTSVGEWSIIYDSSDYSYNLAEPVQVLVVLDDTTPPELSIPSGCPEDFTYAVEKCVYYDMPEIDAFDQVCLETEVEYGITYNPSVGESDATKSGLACYGGVEVDEVDEDTPGTYCITYTSFDDGTLDYQRFGDASNSGQNEADWLVFLAVVADTIPPEVTLEYPEGTAECGVDCDIPDAGERATNLPCSDEPDTTALYSLTEDFAECVDSSTWDAGYGGCETYEYGAANHDYCAMDGADTQGACPLACLSCTLDVVCTDSDTWVNTWGEDCSTYEFGGINNYCIESTNGYVCYDYCETDGADLECPEACGTCDEYEEYEDAIIMEEAAYVNLNALGEYVVPYAATDGYNVHTAYQTVTVQDTTPPTITCPDDIQIYVNEELYEGEAEFDDECGRVEVADNREVVDTGTIGAYVVTFIATDAVGLTAACDQNVDVVDERDPEIDLVGCHTVIEACTGTYVEEGATAYDAYDSDIQSKIVTAGDIVDIWAPATYVVTYNVCDQSGNCADEAYREVVVQDTTPPVLAVIGENTEILEASIPEEVGGATCTDTCTALTSTAMGTGGVDSPRTDDGGDGDRGFGIGNGPDAADMSQWIKYSVSAYGYEEMFNLANPDVSWVDSQQYYCGGDIETTSANGQTVEDAQSANGGTGDEIAGHLANLALECGIYEIEYSCEDWVGNTATAVQYVATIDTLNPTIYYFAYDDDCDLPPCEQVGTYSTLGFFSQGAAAGQGGSALPLLGAGLVVAAIGVAGVKVWRRRSSSSSSSEDAPAAAHLDEFTALVDYSSPAI